MKVRKNLLKRDEGFTLIEVVIVIAIAAALIAIVLLAVGGANRSRRDTTRANAVGQTAAALEQYASNNGGDVSTVNSTYFSSNYPNIKEPSTAGTVAVVSSAPTLTGPTAIDVLPGKDCIGTVAKASYAIYYWSETQGSQQCKDNK